MTHPQHNFHLTRLEQVISGVGSVHQIPAELAARGLNRTLVFTARSLMNSPVLSELQSVLGHSHLGTHTGASQHAPAEAVRQMAQTLEDSGADSVISLGGGRICDATKVALISVLDEKDATQTAREIDFSAAHGAGAQTTLTHIAIPTTLSAAPFLPIGGVFYGEEGVKKGVVDARMQPTIVVNDANMTLQTPD